MDDMDTQAIDVNDIPQLDEDDLLLGRNSYDRNAAMFITK